MGLLAWLESSQLGEYMRVSAYGYAWMLTLHSVGLAAMVGVSTVLSLRVLGCFRQLPYRALVDVFLKVAWIGLIVNALSGTAIFAMQATTYATDREFLVKIIFVFLGVVFLAVLQSDVRKAMNRSGEGFVRTRAQSYYAIAAILSWSVAMIFGRLIAYI